MEVLASYLGVNEYHLGNALQKLVKEYEIAEGK